MFVRELFYKDLDSLKSILKFIYNHNTQCKKVIISAPVNDKIRFVLENPKTIDIKVKPFIMGRVINVEEYLNGLTINDDIEISANVFIEDKFIKLRKTNDLKIREEIILGTMHLVTYYAWFYSKIFMMELEEIEQYGYEGLINAVDHYDISKEKDFY